MFQILLSARETIEIIEKDDIKSFQHKYSNVITSVFRISKQFIY